MKMGAQASSGLLISHGYQRGTTNILKMIVLPLGYTGVCTHLLVHCNLCLS